MIKRANEKRGKEGNKTRWEEVEEAEQDVTVLSAEKPGGKLFLRWLANRRESKLRDVHKATPLHCIGQRESGYETEKYKVGCIPG